MDKIKCHCGHVNPLDTNLCESCGTSLENKESTKKNLADMRYEGVERRSEKKKKTCGLKNLFLPVFLYLC